jgi:hypothetical protein
MSFELAEVVTELGEGIVFGGELEERVQGKETAGFVPLLRQDSAHTPTRPKSTDTWRPQNFKYLWVELAAEY